MIPAHPSAILMQTKAYDFDTSEFPFMPCGVPAPPDDPRVPKITVTTAVVSGETLSSNLAAVEWTSIPTTLVYTGAQVGEYSDPMHLAARLTESATGQPLTGRTLAFVLDSQTATAVTGADGTATVEIVPAGLPGTTPLAGRTITFRHLCEVTLLIKSEGLGGPHGRPRQGGDNDQSQERRRGSRRVERPAVGHIAAGREVEAVPVVE